MKNPHTESLYRRMKQYHRHHQWHLENGVLMPHVYSDNSPPSSWDDVGFILNGRRIMVWWEHPRLIYSQAMNELAYQQAGEPPSQETHDFTETLQKVYKKVGRSRKKVKYYRSSECLETRSGYYEKLDALETKMKQVGIDHTVHPSFSVQVLSWCRGVDICAPLDIRSKKDLIALVALVKRLLTGEATLQQEFPNYAYTKEDWLCEPNEADHAHLCANN